MPWALSASVRASSLIVSASLRRELPSARIWRVDRAAYGQRGEILRVLYRGVSTRGRSSGTRRQTKKGPIKPRPLVVRSRVPNRSRPSQGVSCVPSSQLPPYWFCRPSALASSHREAPFITTTSQGRRHRLLHVQQLRDRRATGYVTLIANYQPLQDAVRRPELLHAGSERAVRDPHRQQRRRESKT